MGGQIALSRVFSKLRSEYRKERPLRLRGPFEIVLFENVAYLVRDDRRQAVWDDLRDRIGVTPEEVIAADQDLLAEVLEPGGMHPARRAEKIRNCCAIVLEDFDGDIEAVMALPARDRRRALKKFPGFGEPGVDKILLLTETQKVLALDSNGLRVMLRLGVGTEAKSYSASYKSVQQAVEGRLPDRIGEVIHAHFDLRRHGQTVCKQNAPRCDACCLNDLCPTSS